MTQPSRTYADAPADPEASEAGGSLEASGAPSRQGDCEGSAWRRTLRRFSLLRSQGFEARDGATLLAIALTLSTCGVLGVSYVVGQGWRLFDGLTTVPLIAVFTVVFAVLVLAAESGLHFVATRTGASGASSTARRFRLLRAIRAGRLVPKRTAKSIALFSLVMALFWLPWLIANFPGGTYWDTYYQIYQCYPENHPIAVIPYAECYQNTLTDAYLCDHHPILDTLIFGAFGMASDALTGNWMAGVFLYVCLQGAATIVAFVTAIAYLRERGCPAVLCLVAYVFFCIMPFVSTWALCMVKDSLFALVFVPYMIMLFEAVRTRGVSLARPRAVVLFAVLGVLLCLTKKTGLYVVVPTALIAAWVYRPRGRARRGCAGCGTAGAGVRGFLVQAASCLLVMCVIMPAVVFPLLNVAPGGKQEVLGVLFQQTARYVAYYGDEVTPDERAAIDAVLEYDNLPDQYTFDFQDEVKYRFKLGATNEDLLRYLEVWAAQGMRRPESYLASVMSIAGYYLAPCGIVNIRMVTVDTHMGDDNRYMLYNPDELDWLRNGMDEAYNVIARIPGIDVPLLLVTYVFWLPAVLLFAMWRRHLRCGVLFVPVLVTIGFCVIAPVYDARYCIPLLYLAPLLVCMIAVLLRDAHGLAAYAPHGGVREARCNAES